MKKLLFAIFLAFLYSVSAYGQVPTNIPNTVIQVFPGAPTGACLSVMVATRQDTGAFYDCFGGAWAPVGGAGAGANSSLSNLSNPTSVNQSLIPGTTGLTLGTQANPWANVYMQNLTFPGLEVGFFCFPGTLPTPPTGYGGLGCIDANGNLNQYNIANSAWDPLVAQNGGTINGVGYSNLYTGATLDVRVNACMADAEALTNGNTSGVCDSSGDGGTQSIAAPMNIGNNASEVTWILPPNCTWTTTSAFTGGTQSAIVQLGGSTIQGSSAPNRCQIINGSSSGALYAMYTMGFSYVIAGGFDLRSTIATASGATMVVPGGADNSYFHDISIQNYATAGTGLLIGDSGGPCCSVTFARITVYNNNTGGIPVIVQSTSMGAPGPLVFLGGSFGHPAAGYPDFECIDNNSHHTDVELYGVYEETTTVASSTTAVNQIIGCGKVASYGTQVRNFSSGSTAAGWSVTNAFPTSLVLSGFYMLAFPGTPTAVTNANTSETLATDTNGLFPDYASGTSYKSNLTVSNSLTLSAAGASSPLCTSSLKVLTTTCAAIFNQTIQNNGTPVAQEPALNLIPGTDITLGFTDTPGTSTNVTITASGSVANAWSAITSAANTQTGAFSTTAPWTFSAAGAASTPGMTISGAPFAGTATTSTPQLYMFCSGAGAVASWSTATTFLGVNPCTGFTGNFFDFHAANGGGSVLSATAGGSIVASGSYTAGASQTLTFSGRSKLASSSNGVMYAVNNTNGASLFEAAAFQSINTTFTTNGGCSETSLTGGASAGFVLSGTTGTCTFVLTPGVTATTGWACQVEDMTTSPALFTGLMQETAYTTTTVTFSGTTVSADKILIGPCEAF